MIKVEEISPGEVSISECTSGFSQCALVGVQEEVTKVRLISDGGIQNQFNSDFPVTVEGVWKNASSRPVDVDGVAVLINETVFGGTRDSEEVSIDADGTGIKVTLNGQVLGTVANSSRFRFIGRGGADIFRNGAVDAITKSADFNLDTFIDARDIDELYAALDGSYNSFFDLNEDGFLDQEDVDFIVKVLFDSIYGDSNLDGHFNSTDLVHVFVIGEYQDGIAVNSGWADGDWSGDQDFDSSDFVFSLTNSEYEG
jgi:hypothetical protein